MTARIVLLAALLLAGARLHAADELLTARAALADALYPVAIQQLNQYLDRNRDNPANSVQPLLWLCQALSAEGLHSELLAALEGRADVVAAGARGGGFDFWRARTLLDLRQPQQALAWIERTQLEEIEEEYAVGLRRVAARARLALGEQEAARRLFATIDTVATNPVVKADNLLEWSQAEAVAGESGEALKLVERLLTGGASDGGATAFSAALLLQGRLYCTIGESNRAERLFSELSTNLSARAVQRAEAFVELAGIAAGRADTNALLAAGSAALEQPLLPAQAIRIARRYGEILLGQPTLVAEGAALLKRLVRQQPDSPASASMQAAIADAWLAAGSNAQAVVEYQNYLETYDVAGGSTRMLSGKGWALFQMRSYAEAAGAFKEAAAVATNEAERLQCLLKSADALHADGRFQDAATLYTQVSEGAATSPMAAEAAFKSADALERLGAVDAAEEAFKRLQTNSVETVMLDTLLRLAALRERRGANEIAATNYQRVVALATNDARQGSALLGLARVRYRGYKFEEAIGNCLQVEERFPALAPEAAYLRTLALYGAGRDDEAWQIAQQFAQHYPLAPQLSDNQLWMAKFAFNRRSYAEAQSLFTNFVARWPDSQWGADALLWAGQAAFNRSEYTETIEILARLPRTAPASPRLAEARFLQAQALCELARFEEAILALDEIVNRYPESEWVTPAWIRKGDSLFSLGSSTPRSYELAMQAYAVAATRPDLKDEETLQLAYKNGRCLEKLGRNDEALEHYYEMVVVRYLRERGEGKWHNTAAQSWFASAALRSAELLEARGDYEAAMRILRHVEDTNAQGRVEARARLQRIQTEHRWHWQPQRRQGGESGEP